MSTALLPKLTARLGLPLLEKELVEQAARKRTYVVRVVFAVLFSTAAMLMFYEVLAIGRTSPFAVLGRGRQLFEFLMGLQFAGIYLFAPAMTCGAIAQEKEHSSLMLLFLTRLGPWSILIEKLLGRLIPLGGYLLISLPLLAYAYSLGGISSLAIWSGAAMLLVAMLQATTLALACSSWFRTTVEAFVATYLIGVAVLFLPAILIQLIAVLLTGSPPLEPGSAFWTSLKEAGWVDDPYSFVLLPLFVPSQFFDRQILDWSDALKLAVRSLPALMGSGVCLLLARSFLERRAFAPPRNLLLSSFKWADRLFAQWNNNRVTRGIVILSDKAGFPESRPVAWRETAKRSLGQTRYLFRIFIAIEGPLGLCVLVLAMVAVGGNLEAGAALMFFLWVLTGLIISVQSASLIAGERSRQTLDVLCTTPVAGRDLLLEKFQGVRRVMLVLWIPFLTLMLFAAYWRGSTQWTTYGNQNSFSTPQYLVCSLLSVAIYLPLVAWFSFFVGLKVRTQSRAILTALAGIVGWCILPIVFIFVPIGMLVGGRSEAPLFPFVALLSPAAIIPINEFGGLHEFAHAPWLAILLNFFGYGLVLYVIRSWCLANADRLLGRVDAEVER